MKAQATPRGVYDLYPAFPVGENKIRSGIGCLADWIERHGQVVIDGYGGVFWDELVSELGEGSVYVGSVPMSRCGMLGRWRKCSLPIWEEKIRCSAG